MRAESYQRRRRRLFALLRIVAAIAIIAALALFRHFVPFRTLLPAYAIPPLAAGEMRVHFLDVGQADCTIVQFPEGDALVVDAGDGSWESDNHIYRYLKGLAPASLTLVCTHADGDHIGGMENLLRCFPVEELFLPAIASSSAAYCGMTEAAARAGVRTRTIKRYDVISRPSGAYAVCLSPYSMGEQDENEASAVLFLNYGGVQTLLSGDISAARETRLLNEYNIDETLFDSGGFAVRLDETDILKAAHHGSGGASSEEWLALLGAETAILSCGRGNVYSHPAGEAMQRLSRSGAELYRTDELGDLIVTIRDGSYSVLPRSEI